MRLRRGRHFYRLPEDTEDVVQVILDRGKLGHALVRCTSREHMHRVVAKYEVGADLLGMPAAYVVHVESTGRREIELWPTPDRAYRLRVRVSRIVEI
jgi:hypothetical protein